MTFCTIIELIVNKARLSTDKIAKYTKNEIWLRNISESIKILVKEGCGIRSIGRILKISFTTVLKRIKTISHQTQKPPLFFMNKTFEMDEIRTFIGNKNNRYWIAYAINREDKTVVDFKVGRRTKKTLQRVIDTLVLSCARKIYTDGFELYRFLIPKKIHSIRMYMTNRIERMNLNLRTHLKRLNRRTICFSRSLVMLEACLRIYFWG